MKLRCTCRYNTLQHLKWPLKLLTTWVWSLPIPGMGKDWRGPGVRVKTFAISHITMLMWWVVMLAHFLWNWVKLLSNAGPAEVYITNISAQTALFLFLACTIKRNIKIKIFKMIACSFVSTIWSIEEGAGGWWALISWGDLVAANKLVKQWQQVE